MLTTDSPTTARLPRGLRAAALALPSALALSLAACVAPPPAGTGQMPLVAPAPASVAVPACEPPLEAADRAARHVIAQQDRLAGLTPAEVVQEASRPVDGSTPLQGVVDIALALGSTRQAGDLQKGLALLDQVVRNPSPQADAWRGIARLLAARYAEQRRAEEAAERTAQLLRDTQRDNQRKLDQLNDKLEALKAIERSLSTRPGTPPASRPGP